MKMNNCYKPGTDNLEAGTYIEVGPNGEQVRNARSCSIQKGERLPATSEKGNCWKKQY